MAHQRRLDLARLDPEPAQLHLRIGAPEKLQNPVATPARQVPGPVHPAPARPEPVRNEPLGGQPGTPEIAARKPRPRNVKLARNPGRHRHQAAVQNINPVVEQRTADRKLKDEALIGHMVTVARDLARKEGIADNGYRLIVNCNAHGGQEVYHLHVHLLGGRPLGPMVTRT